MDKDVVHNGITVIKKNEIVPFAEIWMELETATQRKVSQKREKQVSYNITFMWNLER